MRKLLNVLDRILKHPLNKGHKLCALWRFGYWQVVSRIKDRPVVVRWIEGAKLVASTGDSGVTGNFYCGLLEFEEMTFLLHTLQPSDLFLDVGANAGCYTVLASKVVSARTVAFEPVPETYRRLVRNCRANDLGSKVVLHNLGVSDQPGVLKFSTESDSMNHVIREDESSRFATSVNVQTIDDLIDGPVFLMKVDVEGYELPVIQGAKKLLSRKQVSAVILELNGSGENYGFSDSEIVQLMASHGFMPYLYKPFLRELVALPGKNEWSGNTIFIRNLRDVEQRIRQAKVINVNGTMV